jgi:hypothetical protein
LSVLDRSNRNLSSKTKKHLEEYNRQMALKRSSKLHAPKESPEIKTESENEHSIDNSLKIEQKNEPSINQKDDVSSVELNQFNISQKYFFNQ